MIYMQFELDPDVWWKLHFIFDLQAEWEYIDFGFG